jgi:hypothetical protein
MKLVVFLLVASFGLAQQPATTLGACSPIAPNNSGSITINCPRLSKAERDALRKLLNDVLAGDFNSMRATLEKIQSEINTTGILEPDTRPDLRLSSPRRPATPTDLNVLFGSSLIVVPGDKCTIIQMAGKRVLWIERSKGGLLISAKVFGPDSRIVADVDKNEVTVNPNNTFKRKIEKHKLVVVDERDQEVLNVDFINPRWAVITGIFYHDPTSAIVVDQEAIHLGSNLFKGGGDVCTGGVVYAWD